MLDLKNNKIILFKKSFNCFFNGYCKWFTFVLNIINTAIWLTRENIDLSTIGLFSLTQIPWTVKFLWAPILDNYKIPYLTNKFGRRKSLVNDYSAFFINFGNISWY